MRGYTAVRVWIVLGLVASLALPLFALCPCGREWGTAATDSGAMAADHSCCASRGGWLPQSDAGCCPQMSAPSRESADAAARPLTRDSSAVLLASVLPVAPGAITASHRVAPPTSASPPATTQPSVLRL